MEHHIELHVSLVLHFFFSGLMIAIIMDSAVLKEHTQDKKEE